MSDMKAAVDAALRDANRSIFRTLAWAVPAFLLAAGGLGWVAAEVRGGERVLWVAFVAVGAFFTTTMGVFFANGGSMPTWEMNGDQPPARRRLVLGGLMGFLLWATAAAVIALLGQPR